MASLNKVQLIGNLGRDPELRYMPDGTAVARVSLATSSSWKDRTTGQKSEATEWHRVVFFRRLAEVVAQYLVQGSTIYVEGVLKTRKYSDKDDKDRYVTEVRAVELIMLGGKRKEGGPGETTSHRDEDAGADDGDVPF